MIPTLADHALVLFFAVLLPVRGAFVAYPRLSALMEGLPADVRVRFYRQTTWLHAGLILAALLAWAGAGRPWADLGVVSSDPWLLLTGMGAAVIGLAIHYAQGVAALRRAETRARSAQRLGRLLPLIPRSESELDRFTLLGVVAGFSEELLFRGFLPAYLATFMPFGTAAGISVLVFGLGHVYQGFKGVILTTVIGAVLMLMYLLTESLWPGVVFHIGFNLISAHVAHALLRSRP